MSISAAAVAQQLPQAIVQRLSAAPFGCRGSDLSLVPCGRARIADECRFRLAYLGECGAAPARATAARTALQACTREADPERAGGMALALLTYDKAMAASAAATSATCPWLRGVPAAAGAPLDAWNPSGAPASWLPQVKSECTRLGRAATPLQQGVAGCDPAGVRAATREIAVARAALTRCGGLTGGGLAALAGGLAHIAGQSLERVRRIEALAPPPVCTMLQNSAGKKKRAAAPKAFAGRSMALQGPSGCDTTEQTKLENADRDAQACLRTAIAELKRIRPLVGQPERMRGEPLATAALLDRLHVDATQASAGPLVDRARTELEENLKKHVAGGTWIRKDAAFCAATREAHGYGGSEGIRLCNTFFNDGPRCRADVLVHEMQHVRGRQHQYSPPEPPASRLPRRVASGAARATQDPNEMTQLAMQLCNQMVDACAKPSETEPEIEPIFPDVPFGQAVPNPRPSHPLGAGYGAFFSFFSGGQAHVAAHNPSSGAFDIFEIKPHPTLRRTAHETAPRKRLLLMPFHRGQAPFFLRYDPATGATDVMGVQPGGSQRKGGFDLGTGWDVLTGLQLGGKPHFLRYRRSDGFMVIARIEDDNQRQTPLAPAKGWQPSWTHVQPFWTRALPPYERNGAQHLLAYSAQTGKLSVDRVADDGTLTEVFHGDLGRGLTNVAPVLRNGLVHLILQSGASLELRSLVLDATGRIGAPRSLARFNDPRSRTHLTTFFTAGRTHWLSYEAAGGTAMVWRQNP